MLPFAISHKNNIQVKNNPGTSTDKIENGLLYLLLLFSLLKFIQQKIFDIEKQKTTATTTTTKATTNGQTQMHSVLHSLYTCFYSIYTCVYVCVCVCLQSPISKHFGCHNFRLQSNR